MSITNLGQITAQVLEAGAPYEYDDLWGFTMPQKWCTDADEILAQLQISPRDFVQLVTDRTTHKWVYESGLLNIFCLSFDRQGNVIEWGF